MRRSPPFEPKNPRSGSGVSAPITHRPPQYWAKNSSVEVSLPLLVTPAILGVIIGVFVGVLCGRAIAPLFPAGASGPILMRGAAALAAGTLLGWLVGALLAAVPLCTTAGTVPSTHPHSLFLAPLLGTLGSFFAMWLSARRRNVSAAAIGLLWTVAIALPTGLALFFGKSTTSTSPLAHDCQSVGTRLVANAALLGVWISAFLTLAIASRSRRR